MSKVLCPPSVLSSYVCFMFYYNNKTDQGDEMEGLKIEGSGGRDWGGRVRRDN